MKGRALPFIEQSPHLHILELSPSQSRALPFIEQSSHLHRVELSASQSRALTFIESRALTFIECGAGNGSEGTTEGPTQGGTCLLSNDGRYAGFQSHMGCWRGFMLCEGGRRAECKLLIRETGVLVDRFVVFQGCFVLFFVFLLLSDDVIVICFLHKS